MEVKEKELHRIAVTAIIHKNRGGVPEYLITKRAAHKKVFPNRWTVPGGGMETDDYINDTAAQDKEGQWYYALEKTLRREVREEVNLEIEKPRYLLDLVFITPQGQPVLTVSYYAEYKSGAVKLDEDNVEWAWVTAAEAKQYDLIKGIIDEIEMVDKILRDKSYQT